MNQPTTRHWKILRHSLVGEISDGHVQQRISGATDNSSCCSSSNVPRSRAHGGFTIQNGGLQGGRAHSFSVNGREHSVGQGWDYAAGNGGRGGAGCGRRRRCRRIGGLQRPTFVEFVLVYGPHGTLDILYAHETLVKAEVVTNGVLMEQRWRGRVKVVLDVVVGLD